VALAAVESDHFITAVVAQQIQAAAAEVHRAEALLVEAADLV
jgi:hypothetical protein